MGNRVGAVKKGKRVGGAMGARNWGQTFSTRSGPAELGPDRDYLEEGRSAAGQSVHGKKKFPKEKNPILIAPHARHRLHPASAMTPLLHPTLSQNHDTFPPSLTFFLPLVFIFSFFQTASTAGEPLLPACPSPL